MGNTQKRRMLEEERHPSKKAEMLKRSAERRAQRRAQHDKIRRKHGLTVDGGSGSYTRLTVVGLWNEKHPRVEGSEAPEAETESSNSADYQKALEQGRVSVAYARAMLLGVGGVGKSSFFRGLMNLPLSCKVDSTQIADISTLYPGAAGGGATRETSSHIAKGKVDGHYLIPVTDADEMNEIVGLVRLVYNVSSGQSTSSRVLEGIQMGIQTAVSLLSSKSKNAAACSNISAAEEIISEVVELVESCPEIQASESEVFLYMWDCGGQPVFLSVLQAFLTSKTMFMLMFNAQHDLDERCLTVAHHHGKATKESQEVSTKELLLLWMVCIDATLAGNSSSAEIPSILVLCLLVLMEMILMSKAAKMPFSIICMQNTRIKAVLA